MFSNFVAYSATKNWKKDRTVSVIMAKNCGPPRTMYVALVAALLQSICKCFPNPENRIFVCPAMTGLRWEVTLTDMERDKKLVSWNELLFEKHRHTVSIIHSHQHSNAITFTIWNKYLILSFSTQHVNKMCRWSLFRPSHRICCIVLWPMQEFFLPNVWDCFFHFAGVKTPKKMHNKTFARIFHCLANTRCLAV